jgi:hypothetical protein
MEKITLIGYISQKNSPRVNEANGKFYPNFTVSCTTKNGNQTNYTYYQVSKVCDTNEAALKFIMLVKKAKKAYVTGTISSSVETFEDKAKKVHTVVKNKVWLDQFEVTEFLEKTNEETDNGLPF